MTSSFQADFIDEPFLWFGKRREEKDPRLGLKYFGPFQYETEPGPTPSQVKVGIVGNADTLSSTSRIIEALGKPITSSESNKWLYPDFPGFSTNTSIGCDLVTSETWNIGLRERQIEEAVDIDDVNQRIAKAVNLFRDAIQEISIEEDLPAVVICAVPARIEQKCGISIWTRGAKRLKFAESERIAAELEKAGQSLLDEWGFTLKRKESETPPDTDLDFHNALKGKVMRFGIPIQILLESTIHKFLRDREGKATEFQDPATFAWNFSTALYYKASGKPWRLAKLRNDTCYVGISFFHNLLNPDLDVQTSMAQFFASSGEGIVLRGADVIVDKRTREPHLSALQAERLMSELLVKYRDKVGHDPARVVVHKTSNFSTDEVRGLDRAIGSKARDYVTIARRSNFRFLRSGEYPVLRGTVVYLASNKCLLFTSGYAPRIRTYPGSRIPEPLLITRIGDSQLKEVCQEIMGLTKLNWNTTSFVTSLPITVEFARRVGGVMSELSKDVQVQEHYRFYM